MRNELVFTNVPNANIHIQAQSFGERRQMLICDLHYHDEIELLSITKGELEFEINGKKHLAVKGDTVFFSSRIPHSTFATDKPCDYTLVQFRPELYLGDENNVGKYFNRFVRNSVVPFMIIKSPELYEVIEKALDEHQNRFDAGEFFIKGSIYIIISILCRLGALSTQNSEYSADIEKIRPSLTYIEENYSNNITLEEISAVQKLNPSYFCRIFKRASGSNFVDYLNFVRICKSEKLLANGHDSILSISYDVGFSSVSYFNRIFKKYKNCTPTAYRRAQYSAM